MLPRDEKAGTGSVTETKVLNERAIFLDVGFLQVVEEPTTLAYHLEQAAATMVVFMVCSEVLGQVVDPLSEQRDLNACGSGIAFVSPVLVYRGCLVERHRRNIRNACTAQRFLRVFVESMEAYTPQPRL